MRTLLLVGALVGLAAAGLLWSPSLLPLACATRRGLAAGALVGTAGSIAGSLLVAANLTAGPHRFQAALFGGMFLRLGIFGLALAAILLRGGGSVRGFLAGLIPSYLGFQAAEIGYLYRAASRRSESAGTGGGERGRREGS